ncbi:MAG: 16S rRNA (uracil(1498)-N(3))-methyltransferase [Candidatus Eisenbacteria bacterium]|nr:16S rRNA (uracil(1498)-N(3))-methyltransferase [Candidatus Eisenbacteria bacterium]
MGRDPHPFLVPAECIDVDGRVLFPEEESRHILRVIRLKPGDACRVVDGRGGRYRVVLGKEQGRLVGTVIERMRDEPPAPRLDLGFPMLRQRARVEWLLEKAVEVGVDSLTPLLWERAVKESAAIPRARWERIAREAAKQSERSWLPEIVHPEDPVTFALSGSGASGPPERGGAPARREGASRPDGARTVALLADPAGSEALPDLRGALRVRLLVGPEGGLSEGERRALEACGTIRWSLGPTRLRAETAAIVGSHRLARAAREGETTARPS